METTLPRRTLRWIPGGLKDNNALPYLLLFAAVIIAIVTLTLAFGEPARWIGHAIPAIIGILLLLLIAVTGAIMAGRLKFLHFRRVLLFHKILAVCFSGLAIGTFTLGLLLMIFRHRPVLITLHGWVGLVVAILSAIQLFLSLAISQRDSLRQSHRIVGYLIVLLFILQVLLGMAAADIFEFFSGRD